MISFLNSLVTLRALSDYAVLCDSTNNTPDRIDQNQLWIDVAVQPLTAVEFIYIPVRILNATQAPATVLQSIYSGGTGASTTSTTSPT